MTQGEFEEVFSLAAKLKSELKRGINHHLLKGKTLGMIFTKSSTRTRVSFETGMYQLGGYPLFLSSADIQLGRGETVYDTANVLSRYLDGIMIRTFKQSDVEELATYGSIPVINGLTDLMHPCQILADLFTVIEYKGSLKGLKLAYVGDGNNVANSLLHGCAKVGMDIAVASPKGHTCDERIIAESIEDAKVSGARVILTEDPKEAVADADVVYTDTWVSMGQEAEKAERLKLFSPYQVDSKLFSLAKNDAIFLHCLPAYRGYEVTEDIIDGPQSVVFDEAENRMHVQKAIMVMLMGRKSNELFFCDTESNRRGCRTHTSHNEGILKKYMEDTGLTGTLDALEESIESIRNDIKYKEVFIALIDDIPVGSIRVEILSDGTAYISRFGVRLEYHNIGIGKSLMNLVDKVLKARGVKRVSLYTASKYRDLVRFYYGRGFYIDSTTKDRGYVRALLVKEY
jgi:ornithine carbamoyltransferase